MLNKNSHESKTGCKEDKTYRLSHGGAALSFWLRSALFSRSVSSGLWPPSAACCSTPSAPTPRLRAETNSHFRPTQRNSHSETAVFMKLGSVGQTMSRRTHRSDSCLLGVFDPKPAPHSSSLVFLFMERKRKRRWGLTGRLVLMQKLNETIMTTKNRVGRKTYSEYVDKLWAACWVASHIPSHNNPDRLWINKKEMQYYGFVLPIQPPSFLFLFIFLLRKCLQCCLINP